MTPVGIWRGPFIGEAPDRGLILPGDEREVSDADLQSAHWEPKDQPAQTTTASSAPSFQTGGVITAPAAADTPQPESETA